MRGSHFIPGFEVSPDDFLDRKGELVSEHGREGPTDRTGHDFVQGAHEHVLMARPSGGSFFLDGSSGAEDGASTRQWTRQRLGGRLDLHAVGSGYLLGEGARGKKSKGEGK